MATTYKLGGTVSGYGVSRLNGDVAEFLDSDHALAAMELLCDGIASENDYEWQADKPFGPVVESRTADL